MFIIHTMQSPPFTDSIMADGIGVRSSPPPVIAFLLPVSQVTTSHEIVGGWIIFRDGSKFKQQVTSARNKLLSLL